MSDIDSENGSNQDDDICRDYMRNVCSRGRKCRFKHPSKTFYFAGDVDSTKEERTKLVRMFCHDFQVILAFQVFVYFLLQFAYFYHLSCIKINE